VTYAKSITDTLKSLNRNLHGDDDAYYRLPDNREQAAQYLLLYETSLPYGLEFTDRVNLDKSATKVFAAFTSMSSTEIIAYEAVLNDWLDKNMASYDVTWSGVQLMSSHMIDADGRGLTVGAFLGLFVISLLLIVLLRSVRIGLLSVFPNILPAVFGFGAWGFLHGEIGMGVSVTGGITIGIIVDDTVHFLAKYTTAKSDYGMNKRDAITYALQQVGPAIVFTTIVLVVGFLSVAALTGVTFNGHMGLVTAMVLSFALLLTLIVLPVLLIMFDTDETETVNASDSRASAIES
jgi:predicted RND superfamily exporter protein